MKKIEKSLFALTVIFLMIIILLVPAKLLIFDDDYYKNRFYRTGVYTEVENADIILENLLNFFQRGEELRYFEENERSHLEDVKELLDKSFLTFYIVIIAFIASLVAMLFINKKDFKDNIFKIVFLSGLCSFVIVVLMLLASLNFTSTFGNFHKSFFPQGNYSFPESSLLITMFSESFFKAFFLRSIVTSLLISVIVMVPQIIKNKIKK